MAHRADPLKSVRGPGIVAVVVALAFLEAAWLGWFLVEPLPNAGNVGGTVRRWMFLARALPQVVPGVRFDQSYLGLALQELGHLENLSQRVPIALAATLIAGGALALGQGVLRGLRLQRVLKPIERLPLAYGLGTTGLGLITLILGRLGALSPWPIRVGLGALIAVEIALMVRDRRRTVDRDDGELRAEGLASASEGHASPGNEGALGATGSVLGPRASQAKAFPHGFRVRNRMAPGRPSNTPGGGAFGDRLLPRSTSLPALIGLSLFAIGPFLLLMALGAMLPTIDFDAIEYHLQGPKEYFQAGRISFLAHNVYTSMPFSVEMLHLLGMEVLGDWWQGALAGQLLIAAYAPASAAMIALTAGRLASSRAAAMAAIVYLTTPWIYRLGVLPYVEGPLCYYHAALVWATARVWSVADPGVRTRLWGVLGGLAGGAMACKYPGLISAVLPFGAIALVEAIRRRSWRIVAGFVLGWGIVMTPWLAKNVIDTGNPVYPLANHVFGGRYWDPAREAKWTNAHGPKSIQLAALWDSIVDVAGRSDWQSPLYLALAPLALLRRGSRRSALALWGFVLYLFATWWLLTHRLDRFWLPLLAPLAVLAGLGADWVRSRAWSVLLGLLLFVAIVTNMAYSSTALTGFNEWTGDLLVLRRSVPEMLNAPLARLDAGLPPDAKALLVGQAAVFHFRHPIVYNTVFDHETIETLTRERTPDEIAATFAERGITHVYVDWFEIERYRSPGNYGFTSYVTPELFAGLVAAGVLDEPELIGSRQQLFKVRMRKPRS
ncbi:hypothetical protein [Singulisphaera acidiphila]|uniref:Glycosyltransferase RgtA/B/C/D-like domain-containing protein n=1 Tax=Singulisphaera acidiphila (strain ATCC BAA-1392 / DSM 18658 / VKM B-2454 / MOB10) TaxID=886293 RepID=L0DFA5_SINAD|nr:hypothetical protein [Singulisphaera acidiphila]AGA27493.1 hypothetical protein Sinac_3220 [Singulisphaera acidiphila DSM 18658]